MLTRVHINKPSLLQAHSFKILTVNQKDFLKDGKYVSWPFVSMVTNGEHLSQEFIDIAMTFPQLTPLLSKNPHLLSKTYDDLIATNNPMTLFKFAHMGGKGWNSALGEARALTILEKYVEFNIIESDADYRSLAECCHNITSSKVLWYVFRNLIPSDADVYLTARMLECLARNKYAPATLLFTIFEHSINSSHPYARDYALDTIRDNWPKKLNEILQAQLPNFLDVNYKSPISNTHKYIQYNQLDAATLKEDK